MSDAPFSPAPDQNRSSALPGGLAGRALALAVTFTGLFLLVFSISPLAEWYQAREASLADQRALLLHTRSLVAQIPALQRQYAAARASNTHDHLLLEGENDADAAAGLAQTLQTLAAQHSIEISSHETLPVHRTGHFRRIAVRAALTANWTDLVALLAGIDDTAPRLLIDELQIQAARNVTEEASQGHLKVDCTLSIVGFRPDIGTPSGPAAVNGDADRNGAPQIP